MKPYRYLSLLLLTSFACIGVAHAQESRADVLRQAREQKQKALQPYDANALETALKAVERGGVPLITRDGIYLKLGSLTTGSGFAYGAGYRTRRLFRREGRLDVWAGASLKGYWAAEARARFPHLADGRLLAEGYARRHEYPEEDYFGLGPVSLRRNQTDYSVLANTFGGRAGVRPARIVAVGGGLEYLEPRVGNGKDEALPSIGETFDDRRRRGFRSNPTSCARPRLSTSTGAGR